MARKRTGQGRPGKGPPGQGKSRFRSSSARRPQRTHNLSERSQSTRDKTFHVLSDVRRNPELTATQAAGNRGVSLRSLQKYIGSQLKRERPGGRIRVTKSDRLRATLQIQIKPGVLTPLHTKSSKERYLVGEWIASIKEAGRRDLSRLNRFPKDTYIDGVRLPTGADEVQKILETLE